MMNKPTKRLCALLCCLLLVLPLGIAAAGDVTGGVELNATIGYNGVITYLRKLPIAVELINHGADASGMLSVDVQRTDREYDRYSIPLSIAAGATLNVTIPVKLSTKQDAYAIEWRVDGEPLNRLEIKPQAVMDPTTFVVGVLSEQPQSLSYLNIGQSSDVLKRGELWQTVALNADLFPADQDSMGFFDMLVVDGVDASQLSLEQQKALDGWIRGGGIALVGGGAQAATAFPFFSAYSGISAGPLASDEALSQKLLELFKASEKPLEQAVATTSLNGAKGRAIGENYLLNLDKVDDGYLFTASFSLSEKPLSTWLGKNVIWQRMLLEYAQGRYSAVLSQRSGGGDSHYMNSGIIDFIPVPNEGPRALPIILLALFLGMVGFGSYFLLKRLDKREWMWVAVPGLCILCTLAIWGSGSLLNINEPIAVSYTILDIDKDGNRDAVTCMGIAQAKTGRSDISLEQGFINMDVFNNYYYDSGEAETSAKQLRYEYIGDTPENAMLNVNMQTAWAQNSFAVEGIPAADCAVRGEAGWEGTKLVLTVVNTGSIPLSEGVVLTDYGYVSTPALLPGQTITVQMAPGTEKDASGAPKLKDGRLLSDAERQNFSVYDYVNHYRQGSKAGAGDGKVNGTLMESYVGYNDYYNGIGAPTYFGFSDQIGKVNASLNGQPITRTGEADMVVATLSFNPVAKDGTVRYLNGYIAVSPAELDGKGVPNAIDLGGAAVKGYTSYRLNDEPVFAFDMSTTPESWILEHMDITSRQNYYGYTVELYRVKDGEWIMFKTHQGNQSGQQDKIVLPELGEFINDQGTMYARFVSYGKNDDYADVSMPALTMDGRLK